MIQREEVSARARQDPLRDRYAVAPEEALVTDRARTTGGVGTDPFHGYALIGDEKNGVILPFGAQRAVGGYQDAPNPGDILCAALAASLDSTIRIVANRLGVNLTELEVEVTAQVDVRGTLIVDEDVPVGFQNIRCQVNIEATEGTDPLLIDQLVAASENGCVILQTLRTGVSIETTVAKL